MTRQGAGASLAIAVACGCLGGGAVATAADGGATSGAAAGDSLRLHSEATSPATAFWGGVRRVRFRFELGGRHPRDVRVEAVKRRSGEIARAWRREAVEPGDVELIRWNGSTREGRDAPNGDYRFRVRDERGQAADRRRSKGRRSFRLYDHRFPIRGRHSYGDGVGAGRGHQGQDLFARCRARVRAARAGTVEHRGHHSAAGHYLVIDGRATRRDYVYMHLRGRARVGVGERVRTGEWIGRVGASGNASGCHLHFELWSAPGWYEGGVPMRSVTRNLRKWDRWG